MAKAKLAHDKYTVVLSDTDNDLHSVIYSLWIVGVCTREGEWKEEARQIRIVHTGDWLNKWNPEPLVSDFFSNLQRTAPPTCEVLILNGNHEVEILKRSDEGYPSRLAPEQLEFIRSQDIMYVDGHTLYLHGYPTFGLLRLLKQLKQADTDLNEFNRMFKKAFFVGEYALYREEEGLEITGSIREAREYYIRAAADGETNGVKISNLLKELDINTVIHGHRPNFLTQLDYELKVEVPDIRIIDNDNRPKYSGLGAAIVDPRGRVMFVNLQEMMVAGGEKSFRKKVRKLIGM